MDEAPRRRATDRFALQSLGCLKCLVVLVILIWSMWGNASNFDETEFRVIRDVSLAIVLGAGAQKGIESVLSRRQ